MGNKQNAAFRLKTHKLLKERPATIKLKDVAEASGLPLSWVKCFHLKGNKNSASVDKVVTLYEHLTGKKLV